MQSIILFACASPDEFYPAGQFSDFGAGDSDNYSLVVAYELSLGGEAEVAEAKLDYLGDWTLNAPVNSIGLRAENERESSVDERWNRLSNMRRRLADAFLHELLGPSRLALRSHQRSSSRAPNPPGITLLFTLAPSQPVQGPQVPLDRPYPRH